jgi:hypothetical protein
MKIRIIKKKQLKEISAMGFGAVQGAPREELEEVSSEKQRKFMCAMSNKPANERPEGLSKKIDEMYSTAGAMMGSGSGEIPKERNPEAHKRYVRIRYTRQGLQNFKPNRYFAENNK